ncbi:MAG: recombinase family protein [Lachnospiraceae bacterium]|nr:recombinase family protein [Lachnospiraceae bacterium]
MDEKQRLSYGGIGYGMTGGYSGDSNRRRERDLHGKIAGYYRLSMEDDDIKEESNSITNQRLLIRRYILDHPELSHYEYCEFYDDGFSGTTMNRPGMQTMLEKIKKNEIQCVIVKDLSRFSRDYIELGDYMEQIFPFMGVRFISIAERYDSQEKMGKTADMEIGFQSLLADFYCKDISEKVRSSITVKKNQGKYATGNTPFGYRKDENDREELLIVQEEAKVVRHIFELSMAGQNLTRICRTLNDEKIPTPLEYKNQRKKQNRKELQQEHKYWQPGTVRTILTNESYHGSMVFHKSVQAQVGGNRTLLRLREEWGVLENHHPAIVSKEVFDKVQEKFSRKKAAVKEPVLYALKGKSYCGYCGRRLRVMKLAGGRLCYYCPNQSLSSHNKCLCGGVRNERLEKIVLEELQMQIGRLADTAGVSREAAERQRVAIRKIGKEIMAAEAGIAELTKRKASLLEAYHRAAYTREQYMESCRRLERQISEKRIWLKKRKEQLDSYRDLLNADMGDDENLRQYAGFESLTKEMADAFIEKIIISNERTIDIYWKFNQNHTFDL